MKSDASSPSTENVTSSSIPIAIKEKAPHSDTHTNSLSKVIHNNHNQTNHSLSFVNSLANSRTSSTASVQNLRSSGRTILTINPTNGISNPPSPTNVSATPVASSLTASLAESRTSTSSSLAHLTSKSPSPSKADTSDIWSLSSNYRTAPNPAGRRRQTIQGDRQNHGSSTDLGRLGGHTGLQASSLPISARSLLHQVSSSASLNSNARTPNPLKVHSQNRLSEMAHRFSDYFLPRKHDTGSQSSAQRSRLSITPPSIDVSRQSFSSSDSPVSAVKETHYVHVEYDPVTRRRILNTYEILRDLGSGQHGKVKLARDTDTGQLVAIKVVDRAARPGLGRLTRRGSFSQEDKIRREIAIMKKCSHPHIVKLIEVLDAETSRKIYLILEYLEKGEIHWQRRDEKTLDKPEPLLSLNQAKDVFRDVVFGLEYLHHQGIIHRDIKPSNLLVSKDDVVKISDFGISFAAKLDGNGSSDDFELAKTAGTPAFLAPELCTTEGDEVTVTNKIDIWALGVTLYCLLFGVLPFNGETEFQLFDAINNAPIEYPDTNKWLVAEPLSGHDFDLARSIIGGLLQRDPWKRLEIEEIKHHPFFLEGMTGNQLEEYTANWRSEMKIDVSRREVDDAVIGIGTRIRKKISEVLGFTARSSHGHHHLERHRTNHSDTSRSSLATQHTPLLKPRSPSTLASLKTDRSYILSETVGSSSSQLFLQPPATASSTTAVSTETCRAHLTPSHLSKDLSLDDDADYDESLSDHPSFSSTEARVVFLAGSPTTNSPAANSLLALSSAAASLAPNSPASASPDTHFPPMSLPTSPTSSHSHSSSSFNDDELEDQVSHSRSRSRSRRKHSYAPSFASLNSYYDDVYLKGTTPLSLQALTPLDRSHTQKSASMSPPQMYKIHSHSQPQIQNRSQALPVSRTGTSDKEAASPHITASIESHNVEHGSIPMRSVQSAVSIPEFLKPTDMDPTGNTTNEYYSDFYISKASLNGKSSKNSAVAPRYNGRSKSIHNRVPNRRAVFVNGSESDSSDSDATEATEVASPPALDRAAIYGRRIPMMLAMTSSRPTYSSGSSSEDSVNNSDSDDTPLTLSSKRHTLRATRSRSQASRGPVELFDVPEELATPPEAATDPKHATTEHFTQ
ncbi:DEKNAAC102862 [Brettanomyces naardenensis]|uniref:non-specific serine/threonine protein kinase n=1 Tax=Brettanomyces naardenensis TaxID=13370 RepID=A0A448YLQ9_BRENA|nr:DEKNAAC102862 [Brettanomyces naardenensis]